MTDLIEIAHPGFIIDLVYATTGNFIGKKIYQNPQALLHPQAAHSLYRAADMAVAMGLKLHIWDVYRSPKAQRMLWHHLPDPRFVADPLIGSDHARGIAVDLTLAQNDGRCLDMGTDFDEMQEQSYHGCITITAEAQKNRLLLLGLMQLAGFVFNPYEWWHYALPNAESYDFIELTYEQ